LSSSRKFLFRRQRVAFEKSSIISMFANTDDVCRSLTSLLRLTNERRSGPHNLRSTFANSAAPKDKPLYSAICWSHILRG